MKHYVQLTLEGLKKNKSHIFKKFKLKVTRIKKNTNHIPKIFVHCLHNTVNEL